MLSQTMNLKELKGEFGKRSPESQFAREVFHSVGIAFGGVLVSIFLASLEGRKLYQSAK